MRYIANAFSLQMIGKLPATIKVSEVTIHEIKMAITNGITWAIGHADTARVAEKALGVPAGTAFQRRNITLETEDVLYVLQVVGGRLPEGCTELPEGVHLEWRKVVVEV